MGFDRNNQVIRSARLILAVIFAVFSVASPGSVAAQDARLAFALPEAGAVFHPAVLQGMTIFPDDPLAFDFIIHPGDDHLQDQALQKESQKLIKYFMTALTVPEDEMWVNLSPYEKDRITPQKFGATDMGRDLLVQDYMLKQFTASLMNPAHDLGRDFWERVYQKIRDQYGDADIPVDMFNKIWIVPESANIDDQGTSVFIVDSHLKVMLEKDYLALDINRGSVRHGLGNVFKDDLTNFDEVSSQMIREVIIPEIEREVNEGKTFANLRQVTNSVILAVWYKERAEGSLFSQVYVDRNKTDGIETPDKDAAQNVYQSYVEAFKQGAYNFIQEDYDPAIQNVVQRQYFSGGVEEVWTGKIAGTLFDRSRLRGSSTIKMRMAQLVSNQAMLAFSEESLRQKDFKEHEINALKRIREAVKTHRPEIWEGYQTYLEDRENFPGWRLRDLNDDIYLITNDDFVQWGIKEIGRKRTYPHFTDGFQSAMFLAFPELHLEEVTLKVNEIVAIRKLHKYIEIHRPLLWAEYQKQRKEGLTPRRLRRLQQEFYEAFDPLVLYEKGIKHLQRVGQFPSFQGSYKHALILAFPELELDYYQFGYKFDLDDQKENDDWKKVRAEINKKEPELWEKYLEFLKDPDGERLDPLIEQIQAKQSILWNQHQAYFDKAKSYGIQSVHSAFKWYEPELFNSYQRYVEGKRFSTEDLRELKEKFYNLNFGNFLYWRLQHSVKFEYAPYFGGSHIKVLMESFPELDLDYYAFHSQRKFQEAFGRSKEDNIIRGLKSSFKRYEPHLWKTYQDYVRDPSAFSKEKLFDLKERVYHINSAKVQVYGYAVAAQQEDFENSYAFLLTRVFPELNLNEKAFHFRYETQEQGVESVRAALKRFLPDLWTEYEKYLEKKNQDPDWIDEDLQDKFYHLRSYDIKSWGLRTVMQRDNAPYFEGSFKVALKVSFPELDLDLEEFEKYNDWERRFQWRAGNNDVAEDEQLGIQNIHDMIVKNRPWIGSLYQKFQNKTITDEELYDLKNEIIDITSDDFDDWGLASARSSDSAYYFYGSYVFALVKSFEDLNLNPYAINYQYRFSPDNEIQRRALAQHAPELWERYLRHEQEIQVLDDQVLIDLRRELSEANRTLSIQAAVERFRPQVWAEYQEYLQNPKPFLASWKRRFYALRESLYQIKSYHLRLWNLSTSKRFVDDEQESESIQDMVDAFPEMGLDPYAYRSRYQADETHTALENGIKSVHAAIERFAPDLFQEYQEYLDPRRKFSLDHLVSLRKKFYDLRKAHFSLWHLEGSMDRRVAPYFEGSYRVALQKSFSALLLENIDDNGLSEDVVEAKKKAITPVQRQQHQIGEDKTVENAMKWFSVLINLPDDYNWNLNPQNIPDLTGYPLGETSQVGVLGIYTGVNYFNYDWRVLGKEEAGWKAVVLRQEIKNGRFEIVVKLTKDGNDPVVRLFQIGPRKRTVSGRRNNIGKTKDILEIETSPGLYLLGEYLIDPNEKQLISLKGMRLGRADSHGRYTIYLEEFYSYRWAALGIYDDDWEGVIIDAKDIDGRPEILVEFSKPHEKPVQRIFQLGPFIKSIPHRDFSDKFPDKVVPLVHSRMGVVALKEILSKPSDSDLKKIVSDLPRLDGLRLGKTNIGGTISVTFEGNYLFNWWALGLSEEGWDAVIRNPRVEGGVFHFQVEFSKDGFVKVNDFFVEGRYRRDLQGHDHSARTTLSIFKVMSMQAVRKFLNREDMKRNVVSSRAEGLILVEDNSDDQLKLLEAKEMSGIMDVFERVIHQFDSHDRPIALMIADEMSDEQIIEEGFALENIQRVRQILQRKFQEFRNEYQPPSTDQAMLKVDNAPLAKGGIDLNPRNIRMQSQSNVSKIKFSNRSSNVSVNATAGFIPVIVSIAPVTEF